MCTYLPAGTAKDVLDVYGAMTAKDVQCVVAILRVGAVQAMYKRTLWDHYCAIVTWLTFCRSMESLQQFDVRTHVNSRESTRTGCHA